MKTRKTVEVSSTEKKSVISAMEQRKGIWENVSMYASSTGGDYHYNGNVYQVEEIFETLSSIRKYV